MPVRISRASWECSHYLAMIAMPTGAPISMPIMSPEITKYGAIGYSPFGIERSVAADSELAAVYRLVSQMAPAIAAHQGTNSIATVRSNQGDAPKRVRLGDYTLELAYTGRGRVPIAPEPAPAAQAGGRGGAAQQAPAAPAAPQGRGGATPAPMEAAAILIAAGPDEFYMGGGGFRIAFIPNTPGPATVGLGIVQEGKFVDGKWVIVRQLGGDDIGQGEILTLRPNTILRVVVYRYE